MKQQKSLEMNSCLSDCGFSMRIKKSWIYFELKSQDASSSTIHNFLLDENLSAENCDGFGFVRCSTMTGKEGGIQAMLKKK